MADTFDSRLKLRLQESGGNSGQWGTLLNQTVTNIASVFGFGTHQLTSDADATLTLSDDGASLDALKSSYLKITSSVSLTATRTLQFSPNTFNQVKYIENATTGSQSLVIKQGSGATVTVASGKTAVVYFDGAGSGAAVVDALAGVDPGVTDTLAEVLAAGNATGGTDIAVGTGDDITFADNAKAIFGAGSDLQIYHDGSNSWVSDQGTGQLILESGGAGVYIQKGATETMANFVADGSVSLYYDNGKKFETTTSGIDVTGSVTADDLIKVQNAAGSAAAEVDIVSGGTWRIRSNPTSGTNSYGFDIVKGSGGTDVKMSIDSSGNVGIGGSPAFSTLEVIGDKTESNNLQLTLKGASNTNKQMIMGFDTTANTAHITTQIAGSASTPLHFKTAEAIFTVNGSEAARFDSSKNFLVGTTDTLPAINNVEGIALSAGSFGGRLEVSRAGAEPVSINRKTDDGSLISFKKDGSTVGSIGIENGDLNINGDTGIRFQSSSLMPRSGGSDADATVDLGLSSHRWKDLFLSGVANVGGTAKFASWSNSGASNGIEIRSTDGQILNSHTGTGLHVYQYFYNANGVVGSISASGSSTAFNTSSDYRLKENVAPMTGATERLKQLLPKRFNFIADADTTVDGFLAHEVADVVPEAITGAHNEVDDDGNPVYQGIDQSKLVPLLVATIQELEARITQLENN